jgi:dolichol-phosphate mannosyltransferase
MSSRRAESIEISLIAPTYNERENIGLLVERVHAALSRYSYELVVVDDNSPDGTADAARALAADYPLRVIVRTTERGLASAVVAGFREATGEVLGVIDADLQHPPEAIPHLLEAVRAGADVAIGSRYVPGGGVEGWSLSRRVISSGAKSIARVALSSVRKIRDPLSGFFLFRKDIIDGVELKPTGYKILLEVLVKGRATTVAEVPYTFRERERGESNLTLTEEINFLKHLVQLARFEGDILRFIKFCTVGVTGTGVNLGLLALLVEGTGLHENVAVAISYEISIVNNFVWNELWTFRDRRATAGGSVLARGIKFNLVSLGGFGINMAVFALLFNVLDVFYIAAEGLAILCALVWNFAVNIKWTWRSKQ